MCNVHVSASVHLRDIYVVLLTWGRLRKYLSNQINNPIKLKTNRIKSKLN